MSKEKKEVCNHLKRCVIVNGLIKCKIKLLNLQYFDAQGHKFILLTLHDVHCTVLYCGLGTDPARCAR